MSNKTNYPLDMQQYVHWYDFILIFWEQDHQDPTRLCLYFIVFSMTQLAVESL